jgi:hypothetical protein
MGKRNGQHDYLLRLPDGSSAQFCALVETFRPRRSVNQQIVHLMEEFVRASKRQQEAEPTLSVQ